MKQPSEHIAHDLTVYASDASSAESKAFDVVLDRLRGIAPRHVQLLLDLEAAATAYATAYGDACFVFGVEVARDPGRVLLAEAQ